MHKNKVLKSKVHKKTLKWFGYKSLGPLSHKYQAINEV